MNLNFHLIYFFNFINILPFLNFIITLSFAIITIKILFFQVLRLKQIYLILIKPFLKHIYLYFNKFSKFLKQNLIFSINFLSLLYFLTSNLGRSLLFLKNLFILFNFKILAMNLFNLVN
jgi:hypothetical protein